MNAWIEYFSKRHVLSTLITIIVLLGGLFAWQFTGKEELPDVTFNTVRISTTYSGASAQDVEFYITKPIEDAIQGLDGIERITSTSSPSNSSITVEISKSVDDLDKIKTEIQNQVNAVRLPEDVLTDPSVRLFETNKKAIIDIALYDENHSLLDTASRQTLQIYAKGLETKLLNLSEVFEVRQSGVLAEEININAVPKRLAQFDISLGTIAQEVERFHVRSPSGTLKSGRNEQVSIVSELNSKSTLDELVVQGSFDSTPVKLRTLASITDGFEDQTSIVKVNGREAILFSVVKNSGYGILESLEKIQAVVKTYQETVLKDTPVVLTLLDDESVDVRNRLSIIASNGLFGFGLVVVVLLIFLNKRSAFWVALGIPFSLALTLIGGYFLGYSINGITLAAIIIVLGIVVDDAIIVAENITRRLQTGEAPESAAYHGTREVVAPIIASILTTCVAFVPLYFFSGRFGEFVAFIPMVIFLMLGSSLLESCFLLPSHMTLFSKRKAFPPAQPTLLPVSGLSTLTTTEKHEFESTGVSGVSGVSDVGDDVAMRNVSADSKKTVSESRKWFKRWEAAYERLLHYCLLRRYWFLFLFGLMLAGTGWLIQTQFSFVMFPNEESREIVISGKASQAVSIVDTSVAIGPLETFLRSYVGKEGVGFRTSIAQGRRGDASFENEFRISLEVTPTQQRKKSVADLTEEISSFANTLPALSDLKFRQNRFGQSSGSVFEFIVQENDDARRQALTLALVEELGRYSDVTNVEEDVVPTKREYQLGFDQSQLKKLSVNPATISSSLRTILNGRRLYTLFRNDHDIDVTLTVSPEYRRDILSALSIPVENNQGYLIPLEDLLTVQEVNQKNTIRRQERKRTSYIYADPAPSTSKSPLEIAEDLEQRVFPKILAAFPSSEVVFAGEVLDTRESRQNFLVSIVVVVGLIYVILAILFDSFLKPFRILVALPFGVMGVVVAFYLHQKTAFGFYAAVGTLGMLGVVVNDSIVMLDKLDSTPQGDSDLISFTAATAKTRLRAVLLTTVTTVAGVMPTAYGIGGSDAMLTDMMIALSWGLVGGTLVTLVLTPCLFVIENELKKKFAFSALTSKLTFGKTGVAVMVLVGVLASLPMVPYAQTPLRGQAQDVTKVVQVAQSGQSVKSEQLAKSTKSAPSVQLDQPVKTVLSLSEFIERVTAHDTVFRALLVQEAALRYAADLSVPVDELVLNVGASIDEANLGTDSRSSLKESDLSLVQTVPSLGQTYQAGLGVSSAGRPVTSLSFSQDIARNAFGKSVKLESVIQSIKTEIAAFQITEAYEAYMAELQRLYYTWIRQFESYNLAQSSYKENEKVLQNILNRRQKKIADDTDVNKFKLLLLGKKEQVIRFEKNFLDTTYRIGDATGLDPEKIRPDTAINLDSTPTDLSNEMTALSSRRTLLLLDKLADQRNEELARSMRDLLPSARLSASYRGVDAADSTFDLFSESTTGVSIDIALPIRNTKAKADHAVKRLNVDQTALESQTVADRLRSDVQSLYLGLTTQKRLIDMAIERRKLAYSILQNEVENYSFGKISLNDYIEAVNRYDTTRFDEIDQKITYQQLSIEWKRLTDQLILINGK